MDDSQPAIQVRNLQRFFGSVHALQGIDFSIPKGAVCGFVGANGAGKTTLMRILTTLDTPDAGQAEVFGYDVTHFPHEVRHLIGWMPDEFGKYTDMTVWENLDFYARAYGFQGQDRQQRIQEVIDFTELGSLTERLSNQLSKGQTQRLGLARALIHDPQILIMDEPAAGLDPKARVELKHLIRVLASEGKTIFISSHILSELSEMCDSLLFIDGGKIIRHSSAEELIANDSNLAIKTFRVMLENLENPAEKIRDWCVGQPHVKFLEATKAGAQIELTSADLTASRLLASMIRDGLPVCDFHQETRSLESVFINILENQNRKTPPPLPISPASIFPQNGVA